MVNIKDVVQELIVRMDEKLEYLPDALKAMILSNFDVQGAIPITRDDVLQMLTGFESRVQTGVESRMASQYSAFLRDFNNLTRFGRVLGERTPGEAEPIEQEVEVLTPVERLQPMRIYHRIYGEEAFMHYHRTSTFPRK